MIDPEHWGEGAEEGCSPQSRRGGERGILTIQTWTLHRPDTPDRA